MKKFFQLSIVLMVLVATACNNKKVDILPVSGTMDGPVSETKAPQKVHDAMTLDYTDRYENILNDSDHSISVWSLYMCNPDVSSEGYGIQVVRNGKTTCFPDIHHGNNPTAKYDESTGSLWLFCGVTEGTGIHVERPYLIRFKEDDSAQITASLDPYLVQEALCERPSYSISKDDITLYDNGQPLCTIVNTIEDMGDFDSDHTIWIGEQLSYDLYDDGLYLTFIPGVKFTTGLVLLYDDMPELSTRITLSDDGTFVIGKIE